MRATRPVHLVVGTGPGIPVDVIARLIAPALSARLHAPGGGQDILARLIGQWLSARLGHPFIIENRPGSGANIATEAVMRAPLDGCC
jgi:tripartite-type tricarboxylate transporter receptor subunit TctC